ncbi:MAG: aminotransferase class III-fold pyridoxal phosphate-dependent enzyme, partial [Dehalococcoidia bacterium]|nr:aminotransferase class III-fold pyridoxal phosphate-dependent enzyme [Dehalococcoidia bacterium]
MKETSIKQTISKKLFEEARLHIPGGVDRPVRAFKAVGGTPPFITKGKGARLFDEDGNEFIDYVGSWGAMVLGHAHPGVTRSLKTAAARGTSYGAPTALEIELARRIKQAVPSIE